MHQSAHQALLELIADVQGLLDLAELREGLLTALGRVIPSDWASLNDVGPDPEQIVVLNRPALDRRWHDAFARLSHQNPLLRRWVATRDGRAYRFSDVADPEQLDQLELFRQVYGPLGVRHQIACTLFSSPDRVLAIALSRRRHDFSDDERDLLNAARPFLIQAYRNAVAVGEMTGLSDSGTGGLMALLRAEGITNRQAEVLLLVARGRSNGDIASALRISERTVEKHAQMAFGKIGVRTRSQAARRVWALGGRTD